MPGKTQPQIARGFIDSMSLCQGHFRVFGWLLLPGAAFDEVRLELAGQTIASADAVRRDDLDREFQDLVDTQPAAFEFQVPVPPKTFTDFVDFRVIGCRDGEEIAYVDCVFQEQCLEGMPLPPEDLRFRVSNNRSEAFYFTSAIKSSWEFLTAWKRHGDPAKKHRALDWGCGCGRTTAAFMRYFSPFEMHGCDIDAEAIEWCNAHLGEGRFRTTGLVPPSTFEEGFFDAVMGYSVCTHLSMEVQRVWLEELRRISRPGAILLLSVHGDFAAQFLPASLGIRADMERQGYSDSVHDDHLDGVAPEGYYLGTFQTEEFTRSFWGRCFEILEYLPRGMGNYQDLIVLRNSKSS